MTKLFGDSAVFSTSVEVFPVSESFRNHAESLLHVRGGVSE